MYIVLMDDYHLEIHHWNPVSRNEWINTYNHWNDLRNCTGQNLCTFTKENVKMIVYIFCQGDHNNWTELAGKSDAPV